MEACIVKKAAALRELAISALSELCKTYYSCSEAEQSNRLLVNRYLAQCTNDTEENIRMGSLSALGAMPKCMLQPQLNDVLAMLMRQSLKPDRIAAVLGVVNAAGGGEHLPSHLTTWAEARRDSVKALSAVVDTIGFAADDGGDETTSINRHIDDIFACLLSALQEYTIDDRGDIGAWVREAAMNGIMVSIYFCNHFIIFFSSL